MPLQVRRAGASALVLLAFGRRSGVRVATARSNRPYRALHHLIHSRAGKPWLVDLRIFPKATALVRLPANGRAEVRGCSSQWGVVTAA